MGFETNSFIIEVVDNGKGFDLEGAVRFKDTGLGLRNIMGRAAMIGGRADIKSTFELGTIVTIKIPYEQ